jgi:hypothetical protein
VKLESVVLFATLELNHSSQRFHPCRMFTSNTRTPKHVLLVLIGIMRNRTNAERVFSDS